MVFIYILVGVTTSPGYLSDVHRK